MSGGIALKIDISGLTQLANQLAAAKANMPGALATAVSTIGPYVLNAMKMEMPGQTGLSEKTISKAVKGRSSGSAYVIKSHGGDIRLKYFGARETAKGVSAAPWNSRRVYPATFIKSGWWPKRVAPIANGQVLRRVGKSKLPVTVVKSGLFIAEEMVKDATAAAFYNTVGALLPGVLEGVVFGTLGGRGLMVGGGSSKSTGIAANIERASQNAAAKAINSRLSHVSLNDKMPF